MSSIAIREAARRIAADGKWAPRDSWRTARGDALSHPGRLPEAVPLGTDSSIDLLEIVHPVGKGTPGRPVMAMNTAVTRRQVCEAPARTSRKLTVYRDAAWMRNRSFGRAKNIASRIGGTPVSIFLTRTLGENHGWSASLSLSRQRNLKTAARPIDTRARTLAYARDYSDYALATILESIGRRVIQRGPLDRVRG